MTFIIAMWFNLFFGCKQAKAVPETPIATMEYRVDNATRYPGVHFILHLDAEGHYRLTNAAGCDLEEAPSVDVPDSFAEQIRQIVIEEHMLAYKAYYSSWRHRHVCGGTSWRFNLSFVDSDTAIASSGYMVYPKGNGLNRIEQLCRQQWAL